jgi:hypothetical protein
MIYHRRTRHPPGTFPYRSQRCPFAGHTQRHQFPIARPAPRPASRPTSAPRGPKTAQIRYFSDKSPQVVNVHRCKNAKIVTKNYMNIFLFPLDRHFRTILTAPT